MKKGRRADGRGVTPEEMEGCRSGREREWTLEKPVVRRVISKGSKKDEGKRKREKAPSTKIGPNTRGEVACGREKKKGIRGGNKRHTQMPRKED